VSELLVWLERSPLGHAMRTSGVWTYGIVNLFHILGVSSLFGSILLLDLRLLGTWRRVAIPTLADVVVPVATAGLFVAAITGTCLLATNGSEYIGNPFLLIKFPAIGLGLVNIALLNALPVWRQRRLREPTSSERRQLAVAGGLSLACWLPAVTAGRMIGYW
jgi:hypothetical protein